VITFVLALAQKLFLKDRLTRTGRWAEKTSHMGMGVTGRTLGLVGVGNIAQADGQWPSTLAAPSALQGINAGSSTILHGGFAGFQGRKLAFALGLKGSAVGEFTRLASALYDLYMKEDCTLLEVNPLVVTTDNRVLALDAKIVNPLNVADRLRLIEGKIVDWLERLFGAKDFEVRLLDNATQRLELVTSRGIAPLPPGRFLHASHDGNGISGRVAADGEPYLCVDAATDPLYVAGLEGGRSSMTVPLTVPSAGLPEREQPPSIRATTTAASRNEGCGIANVVSVSGLQKDRLSGRHASIRAAERRHRCPWHR
jgi:hypothetical protein